MSLCHCGVFMSYRDSYDQYGFLLTSREQCLQDVKCLVMQQKHDKRQTILSTVCYCTFSLYFHTRLFFFQFYVFKPFY